MKFLLATKWILCLQPTYLWSVGVGKPHFFQVKKKMLKLQPPFIYYTMPCLTLYQHFVIDCVLFEHESAPVRTLGQV